MPLRNRVIESVRSQFRRQLPNVTVNKSVNDEELEALIFLESLGRRPSARKPTDEEVIVAAWANLAIEEKDLTLDDARRLLATT